MLQTASRKSRRGITIKALKGFVKAKARVAPQTIFSNISSHPPTLYERDAFPFVTCVVIQNASPLQSGEQKSQQETHPNHMSAS